jgi:hypothetical protein
MRKPTGHEILTGTTSEDRIVHAIESIAESLMKLANTSIRIKCDEGTVVLEGLGAGEKPRKEVGV